MSIPVHLKDPASAWRRYKAGAEHPDYMHTLTEDIARAIHNERYSSTMINEGSTVRGWDQAKIKDTWLAVGSWQAAEAVVRILPLAVKV